MYIGLMPLFFPQAIWLSATCLVLGIIELFAHIGAIRMMRNGHFYSPGIVTAFTILPLTAIYGFYYLFSHQLLTPIEWLYAFLNLIIPLFSAQFISVKSMGVSYRKFMKNAFSAMAQKKANKN